MSIIYWRKKQVKTFTTCMHCALVTTGYTILDYLIRYCMLPWPGAQIRGRGVGCTRSTKVQISSESGSQNNCGITKSQ